MGRGITAGTNRLDVERVNVGDVLAADFIGVVLHAEQVEEMVSAVSEAGPEDVDVGLVDSRRSPVLNVVDVEDLLADLVLEKVLVWNVLGDVVLDLAGLGGARDSPIRLGCDGKTNEPLVVLVVGALLRVGAVHGHDEDVFGQVLVLIVLRGLKEHSHRRLKMRDEEYVC